MRPAATAAASLHEPPATRLMPMSAIPHDDKLWKILSQDLLDDYDEELELEWEDDRGAPANEPASGEAPRDLPRKRYFTELFRLQRELIKLQDWVVAQRHKMVIVFEGRDAAGKGGVISASPSA